jgi:hypothetical protein
MAPRARQFALREYDIEMQHQARMATRPIVKARQLTLVGLAIKPDEQRLKSRAY